MEWQAKVEPTAVYTGDGSREVVKGEKGNVVVWDEDVLRRCGRHSDQR